MASVIMNIDFDDEVQLREHPTTPADVEEMVVRSKEMGADTIVWRVTTLGRADFRSDVMDRADLPMDEEDAERGFATGKWLHKPEVVDDYKRRRRDYHDKMKVILGQYDPPALVREFTTRHGLELYLWFDPFDEYMPGAGSRFLLDNPQFQWLSRDGSEHYEGLRCYGFPEAIENHLDVIRELVRYEPDGLYFSTSGHSRHKDRTGQDDLYGYQDPVVERYRERHGVDIRNEPFDLETWHCIKGEFVTDFYRAAKELLRPHGMKLMLPAPIGDHKIWDYRLWSLHSMAEFHANWQTWVDEGLADGLIIGEYQPTWRRPASGYYDVLAARVGLDVDKIEERSAARVRDYADGRCKVYYWSAWMKERDFIAERIAYMQEAMRSTPIDGGVLHELFNFERSDYFPRVEF